MSTYQYLAFDLGAESGRAVLGSLKEERLVVQELHRFPNNILHISGHSHWNIHQLFTEILKGLNICSSVIDSKIESIAIDTWGADFTFIDDKGGILMPPYIYRDKKNEGAMEEFLTLIPRERIFELTGNQFLPFNSVYQLYAFIRNDGSLPKGASKLLFIPDLFNNLLTGYSKTEFTYATTSQLYNPRRDCWEDELFKVLKISKSIMQEIVSHGTVLGPLQKSISKKVGLSSIPVLTTASHCTAAAVAAAPAEGKDWAYISSGTWSLMGIETSIPIINNKAMENNFTNEGGVEKTFRFLKNIVGLWLLQQCRRTWRKEYNYTYEELTQLSEEAEPFKYLIDPDNPLFYNPSSMPNAIRAFCRETGQGTPHSHSEFVRCILESLALKYRLVLEQLKEIYSYPINKIHIIGGGSKNKVLCQYTADATGVPVISGPVEATSIGNILVQALTWKHVSSLSEIRKIIRNSFELQTYTPSSPQAWNSVYERYKTILQ